MNIQKKRYHDLDWLRVLGMVGIFLFHNARFFNDEDWHVKNNVLDFGMSVFVSTLNQFIMPLFFILSAMAIYYALKHRTDREFMRERVIRLLIPLIFGILFLIPPQVHIERLTHGEFQGSFFEFLPHYFDGWYGFGGNFAWMGLHLWYLLMLFVFSGLMLPVFQRLNRSDTSSIADFFSRPFGIYLFFIPMAIVEMLVSLSPETIGRRDFGGWSPLTYLIIFILGYILMTDERYRHTIERVRFISLTFSLLAKTIGFTLVLALDVSTYHPIFSWIRAFNTWVWLLTFLGFASRHLNYTNNFLKYANDAVLPFYILHQTVIVVIGFFIMNWSLPVFPKYLLLATSSFIIIMLLYEVFVQRVNALRFLFGMK